MELAPGYAMTCHQLVLVEDYFCHLTQKHVADRH